MRSPSRRGQAFTLVKREVDGADQEVCLALDANTGNELWAVPLGMAKYDGGGDSGTPDNKGGDGTPPPPRRTNERQSPHLFVQMVLKCMDAATGREIWASDIIREHDGHNIHWESASSPR